MEIGDILQESFYRNHLTGNVLQESAVDSDDLSGEIRGTLGKREHEIRDLLRGAEAPRGNLFFQGVAFLCT